MANEGCPICVDGTGMVAAARHVAEWRDLSASEQGMLLSRIGEALARGAPGFFASSEHGHFHLRVTAGAPPAAADPVLTVGGSDPLLPLLARRIDAALQVDLAVAFAMDSGVRLLDPWLRDLLARQGRLRVVVGDYMDVTEPAALRRLTDLAAGGRAELRVFETAAGSFHPKAWLFRAADAAGAAIVGSSNLSATALTGGVEWNLHAEGAADTVGKAFEALLADPRVRPLDASWIDRYVARRRLAPPADLARRLAGAEPPEPPPEPHAVQRAALAALGAARGAGRRAGLVVLATGLGKTWLAAFDSVSFARVLFVAHREEILTQAMASFRRIRPELRFGRYDGTAREADAEILFASIQTLGRSDHLRRFAPDAFDYIVVDEFHHAAAATYRGLLDHFTPGFLLGLTATPDRSDGADLLALCGDHLVYECDLFEGIEAGLLSPFRYLGVPDEVDYAQIPWRSTRFDPGELEAALATEARAVNALEQFALHRQGPAIGFCVSTRHADFMAARFAAAGLRSAAVHSGPTSDPRATSLDRLGRGELDILFAVDMFNEGVDVPAIGTVMMLRPTESAIVWLQQLGRGLRHLPGKVLRVVDYIGNHRIFLTQLRALLGAGPGDRSLSQRLDQVEAGTLAMPPGCSVTYDLRVIETLRGLLRTRSGAEAMEAQYRDFRMRNGVRPMAAEMARMGFEPARSGHGGWFNFVSDMGDRVPAGPLASHGALIRRVETDRALAMPALTALRAVLAGEVAGEGAGAWALDPAFRVDGARLTLARPDPSGELAELLAELLDWRSGVLATTRQEAAEPAAIYRAGPTLWTEFAREDIPPLFGATFNTGSWNAGIVRLQGDLVLLTTLHKGNLSAGGHYEDHFLSPGRFQWQSQTKTRRGDRVGRILDGSEPGYRIQLFVRAGKLRAGKAAPFVYCGQPRFVSWEGEQPITVTWELPVPVPGHLRRMLEVPDAPP